MKKLKELAKLALKFKNKKQIAALVIFVVSCTLAAILALDVFTPLSGWQTFVVILVFLVGLFYSLWIVVKGIFFPGSEITRLPPDSTDSSFAPSLRHILPQYNEHFVGRTTELQTLRQTLTNSPAPSITAIHGLPGIGKTELAVTYAHRYADDYPGGQFNIPCEATNNLNHALLILDNVFHDQITDEQRKNSEKLFTSILHAMEDRLNTAGPILLVLDNLSDENLISDGQTKDIASLGPNLHLLATTRRTPPPGHNWLPLHPLPQSDALDLLRKHRSFEADADRDAAQSIVRYLDGFTLAIELVAAFLLANQNTSYTEMAKDLNIDELDTLADRDDVQSQLRHNEKRLALILPPILKSLKKPHRRALEYASFLPPDQIPLPWLRRLVLKDFPKLAKESKFSHPWSELCDHLKSLTLFTPADETTLHDDSVSSPDSEPKATTQSVRVHRLIQEIIRQRLSRWTAKRRQKAINNLITERDTALENTTNWQTARWEIDPLDALANLWDQTNHPEAAWLLNQVGQRWDHLAQWTRAEPLMRRALAIDEASFGKDHPKVATALNNLAQLLQATNHLDEAEPLMRRALAIGEASLGKDHPKIATRLNNLARLLQATNRLDEAEPLMRRALAIDEASFGKDHPEVATDLNNLASLLQATNRLDEAERLMRPVVTIFETSLGENHPNVATALNNLAQLLQATNRLDEAEPLMRRALAIDEASFGKVHPNVAIGLNNLAQLLKATSLDEAEPLMRRALAINEASLGKDHPEVATNLNNLAQLLQATNRLDEAEPLMRRALAIDEASFGKDHPEVATDLNNLALLLQATNRLDEAEPLMRRALEIRLDFTATTGHPHPHLNAAINNYKLLLKEMKTPQPQIHQTLSDLHAKYNLTPNQ